jgi:BMFP domain-containing protein YqiC
MSEQADNSNVTATETLAPPSEAITAPADLEEHLQHLAEAMQSQIELIGRDDFDAFIELGEKVSGLLEKITHTDAHITWKSFDTINKIKALHNQLGLTLNAKSEQMNKDLQKVRSGKNIAKAYGNR